MKPSTQLIALAIAAASLFSCRGAGGDGMSAPDRVDSLNAVAYSLRYKDLEATEQTAREAYRRAAKGSPAQAEALNTLGFCAFMRMDFERSDSLYSAAGEASMSEVERLVADIGRMKISQRTAHYRAFCDYRNSARQHLRRIDQAAINAASMHTASIHGVAERVTYARSELAIASSIYYYYLRQVPQSVEAIESISVDDALQRDTAQWLYYLYMRGSGDLAPAATPDEVTLRELDYLWPCLTMSYRQGYTYFDANASQALAEMMSQPDLYALIRTQRPALMKMLNPNDLSSSDLSLAYAQRALEGFEQYGDMYQISGALRTIASCLNAQGRHAEALEYLARALNWVNRHHEQYYHCTDTTDRLRTFVPFDTLNALPVELRWIKEEHILSVPEWIARLREQLSVTYAALGEKSASDYNRNIYLDLLDYTRQDKETESRLAALEAESEQLNRWLLLAGVGGVLLAVGCFLLNRVWRRRNWMYIYRLHHVASLCRRISSSNPEEATVACTEMRRLRQSLPSRLNRDQMLQAEVMDAYLDWYEKAGEQLASLDEERECVEREHYVHRRHLVENKQENLVKKACLLVVTGILPYIDRALYTLQRLRKSWEAAPGPEAASPESSSPADTDAPLAYIDELLTRINEYNDILALWIKMKPGALSLHIESFPLMPLFETVMKGRQSFVQRRQTLTVQPTEAVVKADKALTLFMLNTLADNARKYTQPGGHIAVDATETEEYVEIAVRDDGPGLSPADCERLMNEKRYDAVKGHGFGLMNCRGIIEKYRKTHPLFRVCTFGVESQEGQGSRFYFRLPKCVPLLALLLALHLPGFATTQAEASESASPQAETTSPDALGEANRFAELVYQCNVDGYYEDAILYADSALQRMNAAVAEGDTLPSGLPRLTLEGQGNAAELEWWAAGVNTDYFILLDVRNEAAVAYLALGETENYRYNNNAYTALYKQLSIDTSLEEYCRQMQRSAGAKTVLLILILLVVVALTIVSYMRYFRHRLIYRDRLEEVLQISRQLLDGPADAELRTPVPEDEFVARLVNDLTARRHEYARVRMGGKQEDLDAARDEVNRLVSEENRLHVQNRVLDNCLSALKHETVYYPHRIQQTVEKGRQEGLDAATVDSMIELITYYKEIYTTLTACAARLLDEVTFRRSTFAAREAVDEARRHFERMTRRTGDGLQLLAEADDSLVMADEVQLPYLLCCLLDEALTHALPGTLRLTARADGDYVRFALTDPRRTLTADELRTLFDPHLERMRHLSDDRLTGVEYLIGKQVIRDHDAYTGRRGCRMQAEQASPEGGLTVWFTLPKATKNVNN